MKARYLSIGLVGMVVFACVTCLDMAHAFPALHHMRDGILKIIFE
jgi:hypothetical protein